MTAARQKFSSQADPQLLNELKAIAQEEGRQFQSVLEQAMREFIERRNQAGIVELLAMPDADEIDFEPPRLSGEIFRSAV
jgi:predicted transcriptional regulator